MKTQENIQMNSYEPSFILTTTLFHESGCQSGAL